MLESQAAIHTKFPLAERYGKEIQKALDAHFRPGPDLLPRVIAFLTATLEPSTSELGVAENLKKSHDLSELVGARQELLAIWNSRTIYL